MELKIRESLGKFSLRDSSQPDWNSSLLACTNNQDEIIVDCTEQKMKKLLANLLAVAKSNCSIFSSIIPKIITLLIGANVQPFKNYCHQHRIMQLIGNPGTILSVGGVLGIKTPSQIHIQCKLWNSGDGGSVTIQLRLLEQKEKKINTNAADMLNLMIGQEDGINKMLNNQVFTKASTIVSQTSKTVQAAQVFENQIHLQQDILLRKIYREQQKSFSLLRRLHHLTDSKNDLEQKIHLLQNRNQKYLDLLQNSLNREVQSRLTGLLQGIRDVNISLTRVETIKYLGTEVTAAHKNDEEFETDDKQINTLKKLESELSYLQGGVKTLQNELLHSEKQVEQFRMDEAKLQVDIRLRDHEISEMSSQIRTQTATHNEEKKRLKAQHFRDKKIIELMEKKLDEEKKKSVNSENKMQKLNETLDANKQELLRMKEKQLDEEKKKVALENKIQELTKSLDLSKQELLQMNKLTIVNTGTEQIHSFKLGRETPQEKDLHHLMKLNGVAIHWHRLGTQLLQPEHIHYLDEIQNDHKISYECCKQMFCIWLRTNLDACWDVLCNALITIDLPVAARDIKKKLSECQGIRSRHFQSTNTNLQYYYLVLDVINQWKNEHKNLSDASQLIEYLGPEAVYASDNNEYCRFYLAVINSNITPELLDEISQKFRSSVAHQLISKFKRTPCENPSNYDHAYSLSQQFWMLCDFASKNKIITLILFIVLIFIAFFWTVIIVVMVIICLR